MSSEDALIGFGESTPRWAMPYSVSMPRVLGTAMGGGSESPDAVEA